MGHSACMGMMKEAYKILVGITWRENNT